MYTIKRMITYLFIFLFIISLFKDLTAGTVINDHGKNTTSKSTQVNKAMDESHESNFKVVTVSVGHGETVLSIIEQLNSDKAHTININDLLMDFKKLNPNADPYNLEVKNEYNFPLYFE